LPPEVITRDELAPAPFEIPLGANDAFEPLSAFAHFDGTAAAGAFLPCLTYYTQDGKVFARAFPADDVAAGASADVSWFPGLTVSASPSNVNPVVSNELDYVTLTASVTIGPANTFANQATILTSSALVFDGLTRVRIEAYTPVFDIEGSSSFIVDLWDNTTDLGRLGQLDLDPNPVDLGVPFYVVIYYTPTAGSHTFRLKGWQGGPAGNSYFVAGTGGLGVGGNPNYLPGWLRIST
jgi:hypothetical protein